MMVTVYKLHLGQVVFNTGNMYTIGHSGSTYIKYTRPRDSIFYKSYTVLIHVHVLTTSYVNRIIDYLSYIIIQVYIYIIYK